MLFSETERNTLIARPAVQGELASFIQKLCSIVPPVWIAGGSALALNMSGSLPGNTSDIDIFFPMGLEDVMGETMRRLSPLAHSTMSGNTFDMQIDKFKIQLITKQRYANASALLKDFDFTICMFVTDGRHVYGPQTAWDDFDNRILRTAGPNRKSLFRVSKYCQMGFTPLPSEFAKIINGALTQQAYDEKNLQILGSSDY